MLIGQATIAFDKRFTKKLKIAIVRTNYHAGLVDNLEGFARATLINAGVKEKNIATYIYSRFLGNSYRRTKSC